MPVNTHRKKGKYLFFQLSVTNQFSNNMSAFYINCTCPATEPCTKPDSRTGALKTFDTKKKYENHIVLYHGDIVFDPLRDIKFPKYMESGTPTGFKGSSFQWAVRKLNEVNNEGIEKWVIVKIPRALAAIADIDQLNISGLSLNGIFMSFILLQ